ncbi:chitin synthase III catalytic subunit [Calycina marina]|uniref:Chitin synthase export chaperone n=1 Tax=Calycina marina TaxID=1763456 RepID=A0A9P7ZCJ9_9HELO|nr:chitin synthase III catalytic subunit [Calycina marina]
MGFGDFDWICEQVAIPVCSVVGNYSPVSESFGIEATCYARNIEFANTIIFQGAASFCHIAALVMTTIMIIHVRSKFTAVGRKEITFFFYLYMLLSIISLILDSGVIPPGNGAYLYFVAVQNGLTSALTMCLLINGFVGFQLYEDGTNRSVWLLRASSVSMFVVTFLVSLATFKSWGAMSPTNTIGLFVVLYIVSGLEMVVFIVMQFFLVLNTLQDRWPLGDLAFGVFFFTIGQVLLYALSPTICNAVQHYLDGLFFATVCNLLGVMMIYKCWDSITKEDLEFSVGTKQSNWEVKDLLPGEDERRNTVYQETEYSSQMYNQQPTHGKRNSNYGGFNGY